MWSSAVSLSSGLTRPYPIGNNARLVPVRPDSIDWFFVVDGNLTIYLIPSWVIAGRISILLRTYTKYIVGNAAGLMTVTIECRLKELQGPALMRTELSMADISASWRAGRGGQAGVRS